MDALTECEEPALICLKYNSGGEVILIVKEPGTDVKAFKCYSLEIKENDIRDKGERKIQAKCGIADEKGRYKPEYEQYIIDLITEINSSL